MSPLGASRCPAFFSRFTAADAAPRSVLVAAAILLIDRRPSNFLGTFLWYAPLEIPVFDMLGLAFLLLRVRAFIALWHGFTPK